MTTLVFAAHPDDEVLGCGGTITKLASEGEEVHTIIFSFGGKWPPWKKKKKITKKRIKEARKADEILGVETTRFLGLKDLEMLRDKEKATLAVKKIIRKHRPKTIFTHSINDTHPDHSFVSLVVRQAKKRAGSKAKIYMFDISSIIEIFTKKHATVIFDITSTFKTKIKALKAFKSQFSLLSWLAPWLDFKAKLFGRKQNYKYMEYFHLE